MPSLSLKIVLNNGAVTRKVKLDTRMTVREAHKVVKDKVIVPEPGKEYRLFLRSADDDLAGVWLEDNKTLDNYMLRDGDSLDYICRLRNLRVRLLDDTVKTMQVDEAKTVGEMMFEVCARIGITNYEEYGLCHEEEEETEESKEPKEQSTGTLTLTRKRQIKSRDVALEQLSKKLKTDDNVQWLDQHRTLREQGIDTKATLLLKRRLFFSDRNVDSRDPVQLNLLYLQTRDAILNGRHPVTEQQAAECKVRWINIRDVHRRILKKNVSDPVNPPRQYKYDSELSFMKSFYRDVVVLDMDDGDGEDDKSKDWTDLLGDEDIAQAYSDDSDVPIKKPRTKKKKAKPKKKKESSDNEEDNQTISKLMNETQTLQTTPELDPTDPVDAFLLSIGATLKTFSPYHLNVAKSKIFAVVQEHDLQQIVQKEKGNQSDRNVSTTETMFME